MSEYEHMARHLPVCGKTQKAIYRTLDDALVGLHMAYQGNRRLRQDMLHAYPCEDHFHIGHVSRQHGVYHGPTIAKKPPKKP